MILSYQFFLVNLQKFWELKKIRIEYKLQNSKLITTGGTTFSSAGLSLREADINLLIGVNLTLVTSQLEKQAARSSPITDADFSLAPHTVNQPNKVGGFLLRTVYQQFSLFPSCSHLSTDLKNFKFCSGANLRNFGNSGAGNKNIKNTLMSLPPRLNP